MLISFISFISAGLLVLAMHLRHKDKIRVMRADWITALRKDVNNAYLLGRADGAADLLAMQKAKRQSEAVTELIPVTK